MADAPELPEPDLETALADRPHSRACGVRKHEHGESCHSDCPTCLGRKPVLKTEVAEQVDADPFNRTIPLERVQVLVRELLGFEALNRLRSVRIDPGAVQLQVFAVDPEGHRFMRDKQPAIDVYNLRIEGGR